MNRSARRELRIIELWVDRRCGPGPASEREERRGADALSCCMTPSSFQRSGASKKTRTIHRPQNTKPTTTNIRGHPRTQVNESPVDPDGFIPEPGRISPNDRSGDGHSSYVYPQSPSSKMEQRAGAGSHGHASSSLREQPLMMGPREGRAPLGGPFSFGCCPPQGSA